MASKSKPVRAVQRRKMRPARRQVAKQAIVVRAPGPKPWLIQPEELTILKNAVCKGATDVELQYCLAVARRRKLDPFKGQIWFVPRRDRGADDGEGGTGAKVWIPVVSIHGLCHVGARDHKDYGSFSEPEYGPLVEVEWRWKGQGATKKLKVPEWARIEAFKKGSAKPTVGKVWWTEIYPNIDYAPMVRQMPRRMLAKCAQAQAIRLAYPETGGLYIAEEIQPDGPEQFTPGGRVILNGTPEPIAPSQKQVDAHDADNAYLKAFEEREKAAFNPQVELCLFYTAFPESETWQITGAESLKTAHRDLLKPLWSPSVGAIVATAAQLGKLISQFEDRKVPFRELKNA